MPAPELGAVQCRRIRLDHEVRRRVVEHALLDDDAGGSRHRGTQTCRTRSATAGSTAWRASRTGASAVDLRRRPSDGSGAMPGSPARVASTPFTAARAGTGAPVVVTGSHEAQYRGAATDVAFLQDPRMPHP